MAPSINVGRLSFGPWGTGAVSMTGGVVEAAVAIVAMCVLQA
jgi:hypothetical protein